MSVFKFNSMFKLNYAVGGKGKTLLFIHGLSDNLLYWEALTYGLKENYQIIRMDLRGHGKTPLGSDRITIDIYADDLKNLLDDLNIGKVNLIGFSLGSAVALDFAVKYSDMVSSLVLMSSFSKCDEHFKAIFNDFKLHLSKGFEDFFDYMIPKVLCPEVIQNNAKELEILKGMSAPEANVEAYIKACDTCLDFDVNDRLCEIEIPFLIIAGKYDEICPLRYQENIHENIENSELVVLDDLKHNLLVGKNIQKIVEILNDFYKKI